MTVRRSSFAKLQRDRAKQAKAAAKRERRQDRQPISQLDGADGEGDTEVASASGERASDAELIETLRVIHEQFDAGRISADELDERKTEILSRLTVD